MNSYDAWEAPAKINRFLHITGRRADGYHELQTVFQFLDFSDELFFEPRNDGAIHRVSALEGVAPEADLVVRAARALQAHTGCKLGADIRVVKRIPMGGGLGGGSSNAATTLVALDYLWKTRLRKADLMRIGLRLGADVPVFVRGHAAWAEGVGEQLNNIRLDEPWFLVVTPPVQVPTAEIFGAPNLKRDCPAITPQEFLRGGGGNVCEAVTFARFPVVAKVHRALSAFGRARMSGTGASCFVSFEARAQAESAAASLPADWKHFIARGLNESPLHARRTPL